MPTTVVFSDNGDNTSQSPDFAFVNGGYYDAYGLIGTVSRDLLALADIVSSGELGKDYVVANDLNGVWLNEKGNWLWAKDNDGDAVNPSCNTAGLPSPQVTEGLEYDQSNWAQLVLPESVEPTAVQGKMLLAQTVIGTLIDRENPTISLRAIPIPAREASYEPNTFYPENFVEQEDFFWVHPKPQEYVNIMRAVCSEKVDDYTFIFSVPESDGATVNLEGLSGAFLAHVSDGYWENFADYEGATFQEGQVYNDIKAIVKAMPAFAGNVLPHGATRSALSALWEANLISVGGAFTLGDVNGDTLIDVDDVTSLISYILGVNKNIIVEAANCDQEGAIDISDVTALIGRVLHGNW